MPFHDLNVYADSLKFDDIFKSETEFETKVEEVSGLSDSTSLYECYRILANKYYTAHTRYTDEQAFVIAIKRELDVVFKYYIEQKDLADDIIALTDAEIQIQRTQLRNLVNTHDDPITDADTVPIDDLSTEQENVLQQINKLDAIKRKYQALKQDYLKPIYKNCDGLFRQILARTDVYLYPEE